MSTEKKLGVLKDFLGPSYRVGDEHLFTCPKCKHHKKKLSVNIEKDSFKCWICDYKSPSIFRLVRRYGSFNQRKLWEELVGRIDLSSGNTDLRSVIMSIDAKQLPEEEDVITSINSLLGAIAVMNIPIDDQDALTAHSCASSSSRDGDIREKTEAHGSLWFRMVAGWPDER